MAAECSLARDKSQSSNDTFKTVDHVTFISSFSCQLSTSVFFSCNIFIITCTADTEHLENLCVRISIFFCFSSFYIVICHVEFIIFSSISPRLKSRGHKYFINKFFSHALCVTMKRGGTRQSTWR